MSLKVTNTQNYTNIANAIRNRVGTTDTYLPSEMADAIKETLVELPEGMRFSTQYNGFALDLHLLINNNRTNLDNLFYNIGGKFGSATNAVDISNLDFRNVTSWNNMLSGVSTSAKILVKDQYAKDWFTTNFPTYTGVEVKGA